MRASHLSFLDHKRIMPDITIAKRYARIRQDCRRLGEMEASDDPEADTFREEIRLRFNALGDECSQLVDEMQQTNEVMLEYGFTFYDE